MSSNDEENPEWTEDDFARAVPHIGGRRVSEAEFRKAVAKVTPNSNGGTKMTWIQTLSGKPFDLLAPTPEMVDFHVIACVLSRIPRFGGHTDRFYSVAQHCVEGAKAVLRDTDRRLLAAAFLLHDAHEAYLGDDVSPKIEAVEAIALNAGWPAFSCKSVLEELKRRADAAIYTAAGLHWPLSMDDARIIRSYDARMLRTERDAHMAPSSQSWGHDIENLEPVAAFDLSYKRSVQAEVEYSELMQGLLPIFAIER